MNQRENKVVQKLRNNRDFFNNEESRLFCVIFIFLLNEVRILKYTMKIGYKISVKNNKTLLFVK